MRKVQVMIIVLSIAAIVTGVLRGELVDIFRKASMVCLECIGIG